jgi:excisionase family DNA binding protein
MTVKETAVYMHISTSTVYARIQSGELPAHRLGRAIRLFQHEVMGATEGRDGWARSSASAAALKRNRGRG